MTQSIEPRAYGLGAEDAAMLKPKGLPSGYAVHEAGVELSPAATCTQCGWGVASTASAKAQAIDHAREEGHAVQVDTIMRVLVEVKPR